LSGELNATRRGMGKLNVYNRFYCSSYLDILLKNSLCTCTRTITLPKEIFLNDLGPSTAAKSDFLSSVSVHRGLTNSMPLLSQGIEISVLPLRSLDLSSMSINSGQSERKNCQEF